MSTGGQVESFVQLKALTIGCIAALNLTRLHSNMCSSMVDSQVSH